ncbi:MAG: ethanolamine ammonia-lyase reactivating factor EutA [Dehalococcoidia bacterium]|nr:ethanolamine ammonia-lyase reactivating factor EutA [Dehalococcoidia bacterium]
MTSDGSDGALEHTHDGAFAGLHSHDGGALHWHDEFGEHLAEDLSEEEFAARQLDWRKHNVQIVTVGIDIGSATSHLMYSKIFLQLLGEAPRVHSVVVGREILWQSPIIMTPYRDDHTIDVDVLRNFIAQSYLTVDATDAEIDSGAIILTGEALKRENARALAELFATETGKFVCAAAGHHLEAALAANGSGTVARSRRDDRTLLNVDIGGGTTKFAMVRDGEILATAAVAIGARLVVKDEHRRLTRLDEPARRVAAALGIPLALGDTLSVEDERAIVRRWTAMLGDLIQQRPLDDLAVSLMLTDPLPADVAPQAITFSGGVSEYIAFRGNQDLGDLGLPLASAIRTALGNGTITLPAILDPNLGIRATAVGASLFTVQAGINHYVSDERMLPLRDLPVLAVRVPSPVDARALAEEVRAAFVRADLIEGEQPVALALQWDDELPPPDVELVARGLRDALPLTVAEQVPIVVCIDATVGRDLGATLKETLHVPGDVLSFEGVTLREFDFVDIAPVVHPSEVVPVTIKSLLFAGGLDRRSVKLALREAALARR